LSDYDLNLLLKKYKKPNKFILLVIVLLFIKKYKNKVWLIILLFAQKLMKFLQLQIWKKILFVKSTKKIWKLHYQLEELI